MDEGSKTQGIAIPSEGMVAPVYLLDDTQILVRIFPTTTAAALCLAVRTEMGLGYDAHFSLFQYNVADGGFKYIDDQLAIAKLVAKWKQCEFDEGPCRLCYKRCLHVPDSRTETEVAAAASVAAAPLRLAYVDAIHNIYHGNYRFDTPVLVQLAALQLQCVRGDHDDARDSAAVLQPLLLEIVPLYAFRERPARESPRRAAPPLLANVSPLRASVRTEDLASRIVAAHAKLRGTPQLAAQRAFIKLCQTSPCFGYEFFPTKRTWKEKDASGAEVAKSEAVTACVGLTGLSLLSSGDPLAVESHEYSEILKWTTSKDGRSE